MRAIDLSQQKLLDVDPKAIQQIEFVAHLQNINNLNADDVQSVLDLMTLEKIKQTRLKFSQRSVTLL